MTAIYDFETDVLFSRQTNESTVGGAQGKGVQTRLYDGTSGSQFEVDINNYGGSGPYTTPFDESKRYRVLIEEVV